MTTAKAVSKWVWWPTPKNGKAIERKRVVVAGGLAYVQPEHTHAKKTSVVDAIRIFDTEAEAHAAAADGGKLAWTYTELGHRWEKPNVKKLEVFQVRVCDMCSSYAYSAVRVNAKGKPIGSGMMISHRRCFDTEAKARNALAEKIAEWLADVEEDINKASAFVTVLKGSKKALERSGTKVPSTKALERRKRDRYRRDRKRREALRKS